MELEAKRLITNQHVGNSVSVLSRLVQKWKEMNSRTGNVNRIRNDPVLVKHNEKNEDLKQSRHVIAKKNYVTADDDSLRGVGNTLQIRDQIKREQEPSWIIKPPKAHTSVVSDRGKLGDYLVNNDKITESDPTSSLKTAVFSSNSIPMKYQQQQLLGSQKRNGAQIIYEKEARRRSIKIMKCLKAN